MNITILDNSCAITGACTASRPTPPTATISDRTLRSFPAPFHYVHTTESHWRRRGAGGVGRESGSYNSLVYRTNARPPKWNCCRKFIVRVKRLFPAEQNVHSPAKQTFIRRWTVWIASFGFIFFAMGCWMPQRLLFARANSSILVRIRNWFCGRYLYFVVKLCFRDVDFQDGEERARRIGGKVNPRLRHLPLFLFSFLASHW